MWKYRSTIPNDYLKHYGISGQKWGVRRFQNEDGTYTEEGKLRYGSNASNGLAPKYKGDEKIASSLIKIDGPLNKDNIVDEYCNLAERDNAHLLKSILMTTVFDYNEKSEKYIDSDPDVKQARQDYKKAGEAWLADFNSDDKFKAYYRASDNMDNTELWARYNWTFENYPEEEAKTLLAFWYEEWSGYNDKD